MAQKRLAAQPRASLPKFVRSTLVHYPPYPRRAYGIQERPPTPLRTPGLPAVEVEHENTMLKLNLTKISCPPRRLAGFPWGTSKLVL